MTYNTPYYRQKNCDCGAIIDPTNNIMAYNVHTCYYVTWGKSD